MFVDAGFCVAAPPPGEQVMSNTAPRIALIHALAHSVAPINEAMHQQWPQAVRMNLLDDSLSADLAAESAGLNGAMTQRFLD